MQAEVAAEAIVEGMEQETVCTRTNQSSDSAIRKACVAHAFDLAVHYLAGGADAY